MSLARSGVHAENDWFNEESGGALKEYIDVHVMIIFIIFSEAAASLSLGKLPAGYAHLLFEESSGGSSQCGRTDRLERSMAGRRVERIDSHVPLARPSPPGAASRRRRLPTRPGDRWRHLDLALARRSARCPASQCARSR